jgi:hypothetical protein
LLHYFLLTDHIDRIDYIYTLVFHLPLVAAVYLNLGVAIPALLSKRKWLLYGLSVLGMLALSVGMNKWFFNDAIDWLAPGYFFVSDLSWKELLLFTLIYMGITTLVRLSAAWFSLQESRSKLAHLEKEKADAELGWLKSQLNPHFFFNSLNNLYSLVLKKDVQAPATLLKLASAMRYMIYESDGVYVPLVREVEYISNYIELQKLRVRDRSWINFVIEGEIGDQQVAPLIFIVFIENAFKHGGATTGVDIRFEVMEERVRLRVGNSKGVVGEQVPETARGLGIENVRRRLELIYGERYKLTIEDGDEQYVVLLDLEIENHGKNQVFDRRR